MGKMSNYDISVIIRVKNERRWIGYCIQSIIDNFQNPEIIIVDNNSDDETLSLIKNFEKNTDSGDRVDNNNKKYADIKIVNIDDYSPGKALNLGVKKSSAKNILILSAHCEIQKVNLTEIKKKLKKYKSVFGNQIPIWNGKKIDKIFLWSHFIDKENVNMFSKLENRYFLHNAAAFYEKKILKRFPFDEKVSGKEDRFWAKKIVEKKMSYLYLPKFVVKHHYTVKGNSWKYISTRY
tara:strand:- start:532 stop:1239 length:708 start_codon:yes stop_codon:yes gene_type:complete